MDRVAKEKVVSDLTKKFLALAKYLKLISILS